MPGDLTPDRWRRLSAILDRVLDAPPLSRVARLAEECGADAALRAEVEALLQAAERSRGILDEPAAAHARTVLEALAGGGLGTDPEGGNAAPSGGEEAAGGEGRRIGPWRLERELGRGGMGVVYLAERADGEFRQRAALKLVKRGLDTDEIVSRFVRERQILARLQHPHIARLLDGGRSADGRPYFAMEYVEGVPLTAWCDARRASVEARLGLFLDVCDAVQHAHWNLVVHRDLKPSNVLVTADGQARLLDFGIAGLLAPGGEDEGTLTGTGPRPMTPEYAAPEQVRGEPTTTATDVHGLGLILYELLTGRRPYRVSGTTPLERDRAILETRPVAPSRAAGRRSGTGEGDGSPEDATAARGTTPKRLARRLRGDLDAIVLTALNKEPERRYASVEALAGDVRRHLTSLPIAARPPGRAYRLGKFVVRHRLGFAVSTLLAILVVGAAVSMGVLAERHRRERVRAEMAARREKKVREFLAEMLKAAGPARLGADLAAPLPAVREVTMREVLDRASADLESTLAGEPETVAALHHAIGEAYASLGVLDIAQRHLLAAVEILERRTGSEVDMADTLRTLGMAHLEAQRPEEARLALERALDLYARFPGSEHHDVRVASALGALGLVLRHQGNYPGALEAQRRALSLYASEQDGKHDLRSSLFTEMGHTLTRLGRHDEAEANYRQALDLARAKLGPDHPYLAAGLDNIGLSLLNRKKPEEAEGVLREALAWRERHQGPDAPDLGFTLSNLGSALEQQGKHDEAAAHLRRSLEIRIKVEGPDHPLTWTTRAKIAALDIARGRSREAEASLRQVLAARRRLLGADHPDVATTLRTLSRAVKGQGRYDEAERLLRECLALRILALGAEHPSVAATRREIAALHADRGVEPPADVRPPE